MKKQQRPEVSRSTVVYCSEREGKSEIKISVRGFALKLNKLVHCILLDLFLDFDMLACCALQNCSVKAGISWKMDRCSQGFNEYLGNKPKLLPRPTAK